MESEKTDLYYIRNVGCDDETCGLAAISRRRFHYLKNIIQNLNKNSTYGCMPTIEMYKIDDSFIRPATEEDKDYNILYTIFGNYVLSKPLHYYDPETKDFKLAEGVERVC